MEYIETNYKIIKQEYNNGNIELIISMLDNKEIQSWDELYQLKNKYIGDDKFAIEVFPIKTELVNYSNSRHLFYIKNLEIPNTNTGNYTI